MTQIVFCFLTIVLVLSCQNKKTGSDQSDGNVSEKISVPEAPYAPGAGPLQLKALARGKERPHEYEVELHWSSRDPEPSIFYMVKRSDWNEARVIPPEQSFYKDLGVKEGEDYLYQVQMLNGSRNLSTDWAKIKIPKDKVFSSEAAVETGKITDFFRVFFLDGSRISWNGEKLEIRADEIISENAVLEAFSADQKTAGLGQPGKQGGQLTIVARKLKGILSVRADGQNGGQGQTGIKGGPGERGSQGPDTFLRWGSPQPPPEGAYIHQSYWFFCDPPRAPGVQGSPGAMGGVGRNGLPGGNSAKVNVEIADASEGEVFISNKPGIGGEPGTGGPGGEGGPGGDPGKIDWQTHASKMPGGANLDLFYLCQPVQGAVGPVGPIGPAGAKGEDGFQAPYCLQLGNSKTGLCP